jgi:hypothetical protein
MSFQLADNERIEFRHGSRLKIKKNNEPEGDLIVTDVRVVWQPHNERDAQPVHTPWTNVEATKKVDPLVDSKQRAGFLVKQISSVSGNKGDLTFFLIANPGETLEKLSSELVRLKSISNRYLNKDGTTTTSATQPVASTTTTSRVSSSTNSNGKRPPPSVINNTDADMRAKALTSRKKQILEADKHLGKQYQDLVVNAKCIDEEEFWSTHMPNYASILMLESESGISSGGSGGQFKKGRLNTLKSSNGKMNLTLADRRDILESDAVARRAYDALVPDTKSEADFWKLYFAHKKYLRQGTNLEAEETFARFEHRGVTNVKTISASNAGSLTSLGNDSKVKESVKKIESAVHGSQFDMFSNYYDCDRPERFDREDVTFQSKANMNINAESVLAVQPIIRDTIKSANNGEGMMEVQDDLKELATSKGNTYIPLKLTAPTNTTTTASTNSSSKRGATDKASTTSTDNTGSTSTQNSSKAPIRVIQSSTGATRGHSRTKRPPLRHLLSAPEMLSAITHINLSMYASEDLDAYSTYIENENDVLSILPTPERAQSFFKKDQDRLVEQALLLETLNLQKIGPASNTYSKNVLSTDNKKELKRLEAKFKDEMVEVFTTVTELLRHFYAILSRKGDAAPTKGSSSASKIEKILDRLKAIKDKLASKSQPYRTVIQNSRSTSGVNTGVTGGLGGTTIVDVSNKAPPASISTSSSAATKGDKEPVKSKEVKDAEAVMQVLGEMAKLITRAQQWWENYNRR